MPLLRLNEHYNSVQGEGPNAGVVTQFVRFAGCNMRCPGWPCDTQHAIQPALFRNDPKVDNNMMTNKTLQNRATSGANHVCITGGEPFMQDVGELSRYVRELLQYNFTIDVFTNGSFEFPMWISTAEVCIIMDWKLMGSGESMTALDVRRANAKRLKQKDAVKFVVKSMFDFEEACNVFMEENLGQATIYVGRVWDSQISDDDLVRLIQERKLPWRLNVQMHKYILAQHGKRNLMKFEVSDEYKMPEDASWMRFTDKEAYITGDARGLLQRLMPNEGWESDEMQKTPERWAKMMSELTDQKPHEFEFTTFDNPGNDEMIIIRDIPFVTLCAHHLVPFIGKCTIAYVPRDTIAGLSKFARLVRFLSKGTWNQEGLTTVIAMSLETLLQPVGVGVVMTAEHLCMTIRGVQTPGTTTTTSAMKGCFADHTKLARSEFLSQI